MPGHYDPGPPAQPKVEQVNDGKNSGKAEDMGFLKAVAPVHFKISIDKKRPKAPLGLALDPSGIEAIYVCSVQQENSPVSEANEQNPSGEQLVAGDFIFSVNGVTSDLAAMMAEVQGSTQLELAVRRPTEFAINVNRKGQSVGCAITYDATTGVTLVVEAVNDGPVKVWNDLNPGNTVQVGDRVIAVNGLRGTAVQLLEKIRATDELQLAFVRPAPLPA